MAAGILLRAQEPWLAQGPRGSGEGRGSCSQAGQPRQLHVSCLGYIIIPGTKTLEAMAWQLAGPRRRARAPTQMF